MIIANSKVKESIGFVVFAFSVVYSLVFVFHGDYDIRDTFFWIRSAQFFRDNFMVCGTLLFEKVFISFFGDGILANRLLTWTLSESSIILTYLMLFDKEEWKGHLCALSIGILLMGYGTWGQFGPDTITLFFFALASVCWFKYSLYGNKWLVVIMAVLTSLSTICRFPNVIILPILMFFFCVDGFVKKYRFRVILYRVVAYALISVVLTLLFYLLIGYDLRQLIAGTTSAASGSHTMGGMLHNLYAQSVQLIEYLGIIFMYLFLADFTKLNYMSNVWKWLMALALVALTGLFYVLGVGFHKQGNYQMGIFLAMVSVACALIYAKRQLKESSCAKAIGVLGMVAICFVAPLGSDTVWQKLYPCFCCMLPFLLVRLEVGKRINRYIVPSVALLIVCVVSTYLCNPFWEGAIWKCTEKSSCEKFAGVRISKDRESVIVDFESDFANYSDGQNVMALGFCAELFNYVNDCPIPWNHAFVFDFLSVDYIVKVKAELIINDYPTIFIAENGLDKCDAFLQMMESIGYERISVRSDMNVFTHRGNIQSVACEL